MNDLNISIQSVDTALCVADSTLSHYSCNLSQSLVLDGSSDHILYFTYSSPIAENSSVLEAGVWGLEYAMQYLLAFAVGIIILVGVFGAIKILKSGFTG